MITTFLEEWPLLLFTLFSQFAIGLYLFVVIIRTNTQGEDLKSSIEITRPGMLIAGLSMMIALVMSIFHLGVPTKAYLSIANFTSSWLSREILFAGIFFAMWAVSYYLDRQNKWSKTFSWITVVVGLVAVYSMASIYTKTVNPAWTSINTHITFFGTTVLLGVISSTAILYFSSKKDDINFSKIMKRITVIGLVAILIQLIYLPVYFGNLAAIGDGTEYASLALIFDSYAIPSVIRWFLTIISLSFVGYAVSKNISPKYKYSIFSFALIFVIAGEFLGRLIFYATGLGIS